MVFYGANRSAADDEIEAEVAMFMEKMDAVDISSNSWGPTICESPYLFRRRQRQLQEECPFLEDNFESPCETCALDGYDSISWMPFLITA